MEFLKSYRIGSSRPSPGTRAYPGLIRPLVRTLILIQWQATGPHSIFQAARVFLAEESVFKLQEEGHLVSWVEKGSKGR